MRLYAKCFICITLIISAAVLLSGYLLIASSFEQSIMQAIQTAANQYQYNRLTVTVYSDKSDIDYLLRSLPQKLSGQVAFYSQSINPVFSSLAFSPDPEVFKGITDSSAAYILQKADGISYILIASNITLSGNRLYFLNAMDISAVVAQKDLMLNNFRRIYLLTLCFGLSFAFLLSLFLTLPIKRITKAARQISGGDYAQRLPQMSSDEIGELSDSFNSMAAAIEDKMAELALNAHQKEDFVAAFAHELKTPLTSVIGYADMLYQKNLPPAETRKAAWFILSEGLRLETLSQKLMDLIVLNRQEFMLEEMPAISCLQNACKGLRPLLREKNAFLKLRCDESMINVDFDLFKTLLLNLIDNSIKAGSTKIQVLGIKKGGRYCIQVTDNGRGIPQSEISRITEAFYMVDKSRSRGQHSAGLGLSLALRIAEVHGGTIHFDSEENVGTTVIVDLPFKEANPIG